MPIIRKALNQYESVKKVKGKVERKEADFDLGWGDHRVYILDEHEWFDPATSTKYNGEISRHAMYGPALIVVTESFSRQTEEHHVNDPRVWAWIRRNIFDGHLNGNTMAAGPPNHEDGIEIILTPA